MLIITVRSNGGVLDENKEEKRMLRVVGGLEMAVEALVLVCLGCMIWELERLRSSVD